MAKRPQQRTSITQREAEEAERGTKIDGGDLTAGVVLLIAVPAITYVILGVAGLPVSGRQVSPQASLAERAEKEARNPPLTAPELKEKLAYINRVVDDRCTDYLQRFNKEEEPIPKHNWWKYASSSIGWARNELEIMIKEIDRFPDLEPYRNELKSRINELGQRELDLAKQRVFLDN